MLLFFDNFTMFWTGFDKELSTAQGRGASKIQFVVTFFSKFFFSFLHYIIYFLSPIDGSPKNSIDPILPPTTKPLLFK